MRVVVSLLCLLLCGLAAAQIPSEARALQATKQQWLAEYLMHYDEAHFQTPFHAQQALLLQDSVYLATYERKSEVYMLAALCDFYLPLFKKSIRLHHLPEDLQYLPAAISGCNPQFNWSGRAGLWGLTIGEASRIGLRVDENIDERRGGDFTTEAWCKELESRFAKQDLKGLLTSLYGELDAIRLTERIHRLKTIFSEIQNQNFLSVCMEGFALTSPIRFDENCSILALGALSGVDTTLVRQLNPIFVGAYFPASEKKTTLILPIQCVPILEQKRSYCAHYSAPLDFIRRKAKRRHQLDQIMEKYWVSQEELLFYNGLGMRDVWSAPPSIEDILLRTKKIRIPIFNVN